MARLLDKPIGSKGQHMVINKPLRDKYIVNPAAARSR